LLSELAEGPLHTSICPDTVCPSIGLPAVDLLAHLSDGSLVGCDCEAGDLYVVIENTHLQEIQVCIDLEVLPNSWICHHSGKRTRATLIKIASHVGLRLAESTITQILESRGIADSAATRKLLLDRMRESAIEAWHPKILRQTLSSKNRIIPNSRETVRVEIAYEVIRDLSFRQIQTSRTTKPPFNRRMDANGNGHVEVELA